MTNENMPRLVLLALAGAVAGLIVFAMLNPSMAVDEARDMQSRMENIDMGQAVGEVFSEAISLGVILAALMGGMLALANEIGSPVKRMALRTFAAAGIGALTGALAGLLGQIVFTALILTMGGIGQIMGRTLGWAVIGAGGGVGVGYVLGGYPRARMAAMGGLAGGAAGGFLFDLLAMLTDGGSMSRFIGFILIGAATGAAIAWVEEVYKQSWVTILTGSREGKTYILTKPSTTLGRDELADIPLFGDPSIAKQHASLNMTRDSVTLLSVGGPTMINGSPAAQGAQLHDGDRITLGRHSLRLNQKAGPKVPAYPAPRPYDALAQSHPQFPTTGTLAPPAQLSAATGTITLAIIAGPYTGQLFQSGPGLLRVGRDDTCTIPLPQDFKISRNHADIQWDGVNWSVRDLNSTNGLWVNGERTVYRILTIGDQIGAGQTVLRVDGI